MIKRGMSLARQLDAILSAAYANNPALLAAWKSAFRVQRDPQPSEDETSGSTVALVAAPPAGSSVA